MERKLESLISPPRIPTVSLDPETGIPDPTGEDGLVDLYVGVRNGDDP